MRSVKVIYGNRGTIAKNSYDWKSPLQGSENIIVTLIEGYFMLPWSRHYSKSDEGQYAVRVLTLIRTAIDSGHIPSNLNFTYFIPAELFFTNKAVSRTIVEAYFNRISDYLMEKKVKPEDVRVEEYKEMAPE